MSEVLAAVNATLNGIAFCLLLAGYVSVRRGHQVVHMRFMGSAVLISALFLISYVTRHALYGSRSYAGPEGLKTIYFVILATHVVLAAGMVIPILIVLRRALAGRLDAHKRLARWVLPVWLYVSVTGVVIYLMLYQL